MSRSLDEAARAWRAAVLEKDGKTCVECGAKSRLHAHHIKSFSKHPELRYDVSNGITLCIPCHADKHPRHSRLILSVKGTPKNLGQGGLRTFPLSDRHDRILLKLKKQLGLTMKKTIQLALEALVEKEEARDQLLAGSYSSKGASNGNERHRSGVHGGSDQRQGVLCGVAARTAVAVGKHGGKPF